jgi:hypothetical protein
MQTMEKLICLWRPLDPEGPNRTRQYICVHCGRTVTIPPDVEADYFLADQPACKPHLSASDTGSDSQAPKENESIQSPGLMMQGLKYAKATGRWFIDGRPVRSEAEIRLIYDECCKVCDYFNAKKRTCNICKCRVRRSGPAIANKIAMATEHCPESKW